MDRRTVACVLIIGFLAILITFRKKDSPPLQQRSSSVGAIRPYEFYKISVRWPKSVCGSTPGCITPPYFTIHGLWPHYKPDIQVPPYDPSDPNRCTNAQPSSDTSITTASLAPILSDMGHYWPSLSNPTTPNNLIFWHHEWNEHGKCWDQPKNPNAYYRQALNFLRQNDIVDYLRKAGIVPDNTKTYDQNDIAKAIKDKLGKIPEINCDNQNQLREIRVCYDHKRRIDCPTPFTGTCTSHLLLFPA